jgi:hypothetical protein
VFPELLTESAALFSSSNLLKVTGSVEADAIPREYEEALSSVVVLVFSKGNEEENASVVVESASVVVLTESAALFSSSNLVKVAGPLVVDAPVSSVVVLTESAAPSSSSNPGYGVPSVEVWLSSAE